MELATRDGYGKALAEIGKDKRIVALDADLSESTRSSKFAEKYPERFFEMGVSEQDMIGTAAGLAASGKIPFASSFAIFITGNAYQQIRLMAGISKLNIRIVGSHAGLFTGEDGASHQALEDISLMRGIPGMTVIQPADAIEAEKAVYALAAHKGPAYLRLTRCKLPIIFDSSYKFEIGKAVILKKERNAEATIFATGSMVHEALKAYTLLKKENITVNIVNIHTIKPLDSETIIDLAKKTRAVVTAEDHSIIGGLGSAISELLSQEQPTPIECIGVNDQFGESAKPADLYKKYGLTALGITKAAKKVIRRKKK